MSSAQRRARFVLMTSGITASAVTLGVAAPAMAVAPTQLRADCEWRTPADQARNIQTCTFFSESLQRDVSVEVRASDHAEGGTEQGIYFLDGLGANNDYNTWANPDVGEVEAYSTGVNLVLPAGGAGEWMTNWQSDPEQNGKEVPAPQWDTFLAEELPTYLNENFSVQQRNNAVVGVSMSAGPAITVALNHPDVFSVVRAFSGFYQTDNAFGHMVIPFIQSDRAGITNGGIAMWGDPSKPGNVWADNDVSERLAEIKASGQTVIISVGNGVPPLKTVLALAAQGGVLAAPQIVLTIATGAAIEMASMLSTAMLNVQAVVTGTPVRFQYNFGSHDFYSWSGSASSDAAAIEKALAEAEAKSKASVQAMPTAAGPSYTTQAINTAVVKQVSTAPAVVTPVAEPVVPPASPATPTAAASPVLATPPTTSVTVPASSVTTPASTPTTTPTPAPSSDEQSVADSPETTSVSTVPAPRHAVSESDSWTPTAARHRLPDPAPAAPVG